MGAPESRDSTAFSVAAGRDAGLTDGRMRGRSFARPHHGVRVWVRGEGEATGDGDVRERCDRLLPALPAGAIFSHATAARLWGMPLPLAVPDALHVMVPDATPVRRPGVIGWTRAGELGGVQVRHGMPVPSAADTWVMLAAMNAGRGERLSRENLVAIGDFLVSGERRSFGRETPLATIESLHDAVSRHGSRRGAVALRWALERVRMPVDSPQETLLRLALVAARLPEPVVQPPVPTAAGVRHPDLGYLERRLLIEYLGDVHRTDRETWRRDLVRVQLFEDAGYRVILAGAADARPSGIRPFTDRVRRALSR